MVFGIGGVDGDDEVVAPIDAASDFGGFWFFRGIASGVEDVFWEGGAEAVAVDDRDDIEAWGAGPAEDFDDASARGFFLVIPLVD